MIKCNMMQYNMILYNRSEFRTPGILFDQDLS